MKGQSTRRQARAWKRAEKIYRAAATAVCLAVLLVQTGVSWSLARPAERPREQIETEETKEAKETPAPSSTPVPADVRAPEKADGSGRAGKVLLTAGRTANQPVPGWQQDEKGWWYACGDETAYQSGWEEIDGQRYHFDEEGYRDTGWTAIAGEGYYFDENGVLNPDADSSRLLALTFDDGPGRYTGRLLDLLETTGARATFFMLGRQVKESGAETIPRMKQLGSIIRSHSYDHPNLKTAGPETARQQFALTDEQIAQYNGGEGAQVIRFPYGEYTKELSADTGRPCIYWNVDSMDWDSQNVQAIIQEVSGGIEGGEIILMHDIYETTVAACEELIPELQAQGWQFVTIEELAAANGYELEPGVTYFGFTQYEKENGKVTDKNR